MCVIILCSYFHGSSRAFTTSRRERQKKEIFWERWRKVWIRKLRLLLPWSILGLGTKSLLAKVSRCIPHFLPKLASHHSWPCRRSVPQLSPSSSAAKNVPSKLSFNFDCHKCLLRSGIIRQKMAIKNSRHDYAIIFKPSKFLVDYHQKSSCVSNCSRTMKNTPPLSSKTTSTR